MVCYVHRYMLYVVCCIFCVAHRRVFAFFILLASLSHRMKISGGTYSLAVRVPIARPNLRLFVPTLTLLFVRRNLQLLRTSLLICSATDIEVRESLYPITASSLRFLGDETKIDTVVVSDIHTQTHRTDWIPTFGFLAKRSHS